MDAPCTGVECAKMEVLLTPEQGTPMSEITVIGLDLAKHVFQVHGADPDGRPVLRKRLRRGQVLEFFASLSPCLIGIPRKMVKPSYGRNIGRTTYAIFMRRCSLSSASASNASSISWGKKT